MRTLVWSLVLLTLASSATPGCRWRDTGGMYGGDPDLAYFRSVATAIDVPDVPSDTSGVLSTAPPLTLSDDAPIDYWDLSLQECVQMALTNSQVMRDLGGLVLQAPESVDTVFEPAVVETDPRFGLDAALSAFDANFSTSAFWENNDRPLNNPFFIGGRTLKQDLGYYVTEFNKRSAQGSEFYFRNITDYDANNTPGNPFPSVWNTMLEAEMRQPLLQGFGTAFNRIAGPGDTPGVYNGVLIARLNTDMSLNDFEMGVRNLVSDVESAYWELYYGYRDLDAKLAARQRALETWRRIHALNVTGRQGGETDKEAQAREQYFRLDEEVQNALAGRLQDRTRTFTFRGVGGIQNNERRLRWLMGIPVNDGRLIRTSDEPLMAKIVFDWQEAIAEALMRRAELRKQKWQIKRRELEVIASRNFMLPRLDAVGLYRWRGFGERLIDSDFNKPQFNNAWGDLATGDFQEWQLGVEFEMPIGFRQAHAGVRNAELNLARERALLREQERDVSLGLSEALADMDRAYEVAQTNFNRRKAALDALGSLESKYQVAEESQKTQLLAVVLDAQRQVADAESRYYRSLVEYTLAVRQVHFQKGSLLDYSEVTLSEGAWPDKAYRDAARRERLRTREWRLMNFLVPRRTLVSRGGYGQQTAEGDDQTNVYYPYDGERQPGDATTPAGGAESLDNNGGAAPGGPAPPQPLPEPSDANRAPSQTPSVVREAVQTARRQSDMQQPASGGSYIPSPATLDAGSRQARELAPPRPTPSVTAAPPVRTYNLSDDSTSSNRTLSDHTLSDHTANPVYRLGDQPQDGQVRQASVSDASPEPTASGGTFQPRSGQFYGPPTARPTDRRVVQPADWYGAAPESSPSRIPPVSAETGRGALRDGPGGPSAPQIGPPPATHYPATSFHPSGRAALRDIAAPPDSQPAARAYFGDRSPPPTNSVPPSSYNR
ncbi:MAG: TolC family protein [Pirellulaceae bacterium]